MEALKRLTLALAAVAFMGVGCSDDDGDDKPTTNLDAGNDAALDANTPKPDSGGGNDAAAALECPSYTLPTATNCGGNHCKQTPAQLRTAFSANAVCKAEKELDQFCQLTSVNKVTDCVTQAYLGGGASDPAVLKTKTTECASAALTDYSAACLGCFVDSATCAAANCISVCLPNSKTAACDACRVKNCIPAFYTCSGINNPL